MVLHLDLTYAMDCWKKWFVHFKAGTCQLFLIDWPNGFVTIHVKIDGSISDEKSDYELDWVSYIVSLAKTGCKKVGAFIPSMKFLSSKVGLSLSKYVIQSCLKYCLLV